MARIVFDRDVLRYTLGEHNFRLLWGDSICNGLGMSGEQVVLGLLVYRVTGSSVWVGLALALYFVPSLFIGAFAGAVADWMDRRELLRRCELAIAVALGVFAILLGVGVVHVGALLAMAVASGTLRALYAPARLSYAYDLVGAARAVGGLSMMNIGFRIGQLVGALLAGFAAHRFGVEYAYGVLAAGHAIGFALLAQLQSTGVASERDNAPFGENLAMLFRELRSNRDLLTVIVVMISVGIFGFSYITVLPELATQELGAGAQELGFMHAARAAGGLAGVVILTAVGMTHHRGLLLVATVVIFGGGVVLLGTAGTLGMVVTALLLTAAVSAVYDVLTQSVMQVVVPNRLRGRAMGIWVLVVGIEPVGHVLLGSAAALLGVALALKINGTVLLLVGLLALKAAPRLRRL